MKNTLMYKLAMEFLNSLTFILFPPFCHMFSVIFCFYRCCSMWPCNLQANLKERKKKKDGGKRWLCWAIRIFCYVWSEVQTQRENPSVNKTRILNQSSKQKAYICTRVFSMYWLIIGFLGSIAVELRENEDVGIKQYQCTLNFKAQCILFGPSNSQSRETCPW